MSYKEKYIKYKKKYLDLKFNIYGGDLCINQEEEKDDCKEEKYLLKVFKEKVKNLDVGKILEIDNKYYFTKYDSDVQHLLTWENAKKYNYDNIDHGKRFLTEYQKFRELFVNCLIKKSMKKIQCTDLDCPWDAFGSTNITSDYDITIHGPYSSNIVQKFNDEFYYFWKETSATIFDTNLYGTSFFSPSIPDNYDLFKDNGGKLNEYIRLSNKENILAQRIWAFVKIIKFFDKFDDNSVDKQNFMQHIHKPSMDKFREHYNEAKTKFSDLTLPITIRESNEKYGKILEDIRAKKNKFEQSTTDEEKKFFGEKLLEAQSYANFFGQETYFTQGAFFHVVGIIQGKIDTLEKIITVGEYMDSLLENFGDFIKVFHEFSHDDIGYEMYNEFLIESSKYISRIFDAMDKILLQLCIENDLDQNLHNNMESIRKNVRGSGNLEQSEIDTLLNEIYESLNFNKNSVKPRLELYDKIVDHIFNDFITKYYDTILNS